MNSCFMLLISNRSQMMSNCVESEKAAEKAESVTNDVF